MKKIIISGAKTNNLKNIDVKIPRDKLVVITGVSGSGKSSLAFDTIFAEGQRRYVESLSTYARQFLGMIDKPPIESISGLSPAISIDQKSAPRNPRSTVGTVTEIYDYLRLLFARVGKPHCPICGKKVEQKSGSEIVDSIAKFPSGKKIILLAPIVKGKKGSHENVLEKIRRSGFVRIRVDNEIFSVADEISLDPKKSHCIEIVVDRLFCGNFSKKFKKNSSGQEFEEKNEDRSRLADSVETALKFGNGIISILDPDSKKIETFSENFICPEHGAVIDEVEPRSFSFNSPFGACSFCHGLGTRMVANPKKIIPNENLTIAEGAILPWANLMERNTWHRRILEVVAKKFKFDLKTPFKNISEKNKEIILFGTGVKEYSVKMNTEKISGNVTVKFEGVVHNLERRYRETESDFARKQIEKFLSEQTCPECNGKRLKKEILGILVGEKNIIEIADLSISELKFFLINVVRNFSDYRKTIAKPILEEIKNRLEFLENVGLYYLTLSRTANTLSGGEAQRIRLATQIGSQLQGVLYVLDEPSIGLHQRDNARLIGTLRNLQKIGNTVLVVEHDEETMRAADYILEIGPGAGKYGGEVVAAGTPEEIFKNPKSETGKFLTGKKSIPLPKKNRPGNGKMLKIIEASENNLKNIDVEIPLGKFIGITGVSGSGKSSLVNRILAPELQNVLNRAQKKTGKFKKITGIGYLDKTIVIDQSAIGRTPRSNPATYTGVFTDIRDLFAKNPEAKLRGYQPGRFSFNVKGGRCESCNGDGVKKIEMHFLSDIYVPCDVCHGKRYNNETLEITWHGKNIAEVLEMTVNDSLQFFKNIPAIATKLEVLEKVGLGYIKLGQSALTLSGGEAQRIKLSTELAKKSTGKTFYILDEPTTGLHFSDIEKLLRVLNALVNSGNTVLVIEHNLDVIKNCDFLIDLGPNGGSDGGKVIATGTPLEISKNPKSETGKFLKSIFVESK